MLQPAKISPTLAFYYENAESHILLHDSLVDSKTLADCPAYHDPAFRDPDVLKQLAVRLWKANMLELCFEAVKDFTTLFTVVKKDLPGLRKTRMVWDERRLNLQCKAPPSMPMGSPSCFAQWDLTELQSAGGSMWSVTGDLPDWFYRIKAPSKLLPYCILRDLSPEMLEGALEEEGQKASDDQHQRQVMRAGPSYVMVVSLWEGRGGAGAGS